MYSQEIMHKNTRGFEHPGKEYDCPRCQKGPYVGKINSTETHENGKNNAHYMIGVEKNQKRRHGFSRGQIGQLRRLGRL